MTPWRCNSFHGHVNGSKKSPEYRTWQEMFKRCESEAHPSYANYGGRGIRVCERWKTFTNFLADMGNKPSPKHSIDRIDNDKNYEPGNCRWATRTAQNLNKDYKPGKCGFVGVGRWGKKFAARIRLNRKTIVLGTFDTPEEASVAYEEAKRKAIESENVSIFALTDGGPMTATQIRDEILNRARETVPESHKDEVIFHALQIAAAELERLRPVVTAWLESCSCDNEDRLRDALRASFGAATTQAEPQSIDTRVPFDEDHYDRTLARIQDGNKAKREAEQDCGEGAPR